MTTRATYPIVWSNLGLTHWGRDKMTTISQTTVSNAFSWIKLYEFRLEFHWILSLRVQLTIFQHWFIMTWRRPGDKPLSEPMMVWLPTHICVTRPQWVNICPINQFYLTSAALWCESVCGCMLRRRLLINSMNSRGLKYRCSPNINPWFQEVDLV